MHKREVNIPVNFSSSQISTAMSIYSFSKKINLQIALEPRFGTLKENINELSL